MHLRHIVAIGAITAAGLVGTGVLSAGADVQPNHGHGFNCTHGDVASRDRDRGNGHECLPAVTVTTTPTTSPTTTAPAASVAAQTVTVQPRLTG